MKDILLIITIIFTGISALILLCRLPFSPLHILLQSITSKMTTGPDALIYKVLVWLKHGWKFTVKEAVMTPLCLTFIGAAIILLLKFII